MESESGAAVTAVTAAMWTEVTTSSEGRTWKSVLRVEDLRLAVDNFVFCIVSFGLGFTRPSNVCSIRFQSLFSLLGGLVSWFELGFRVQGFVVRV